MKIFYSKYPKDPCMELKCESSQVNKVCGSDGVTHANECYLNMTACITKQKITVAYLGPCLDEQINIGSTLIA
jgi:hypothetical protein